MPRLTIGMATYRDYKGLWMTIQSLCLYHDLRDVEILVVDNSPAEKDKDGNPIDKHTAANVALIEHWGTRNAEKFRYISMPTPTGTSQSRNRVFAEASSPVVACCDSHVIFPYGVVDTVKKYFEANPLTMDLFSGPMIYSDLKTSSTHFDTRWREGMWGTWGQGWRCSCGYVFCATDLEKDKTTFTAMMPPQVELKACPQCGREFPELGWSGHEPPMIQMGFHYIAHERNSDPFEIPAQGLGFFVCRKEAWLGFNEHCRGFGGEENCYHELVRQKGNRCMCHPGFGWHHCFGHPDGIQYPAGNDNKVRNYILWYNQLGFSLDPVHKSFVETGIIREQTWQKMVDDPIGYYEAYIKPFEKQNVMLQQPHVIASTKSTFGPRSVYPLDEVVKEVRRTPRDLNEHIDTIRGFASHCQHITAFVKRREWNAILAAAHPATLIVHQTERDPVFLLRVREALIECPEKHFRTIATYTTHDGSDSLKAEPAGDTDMLVIDTVHSGERLSQELDRHAKGVARFIMIRGTGSFGFKEEGGTGLGLYSAMMWFLEHNPDWFVAFHTDRQYGLTVLSRFRPDHPRSRIWVWPPGFGPGTELKKMLDTIGIKENPNCDCNGRRVSMDKWGVVGCREHFDEIKGWMVEGAERWGWSGQIANLATGQETMQLSLAEKLKIGWNVVMSGLAFHISIKDPYGSLVTEAIRRAEVEDKKKGRS